MLIPKHLKLEKACSKDECRKSIENILICKTKEGTFAVATNGRMMAVIPVTVEGDYELGLLSPKALIEGRKLPAYKNQPDITMTLNGDIAFTDGTRLPRPDQEVCGNYPNWKQIAVDAEGKSAVFTVGLDPALLMDLAEALGRNEKHKFVTLEFVSPEEPVRVKVQGEPLNKGVLMPCRVA